MMAKMKVHGISDKVMGLSSPRTVFFISLEPVKVLSAKFGRTRYCKGYWTQGTPTPTSPLSYRVDLNGAFPYS